MNFRKGQSKNKKKTGKEVPDETPQGHFIPFDPKSRRKEKPPEENPATAKVSR